MVKKQLLKSKSDSAIKIIHHHSQQQHHNHHQSKQHHQHQLQVQRALLQQRAKARQAASAAGGGKPAAEKEPAGCGVNLSFAGCGFLGIYHVGVASCFHQYAPQLSMHKISGSSAGALVAVAYLCGNLQLAYATTDILRVAIDARAHALGPFHPSFDIQRQVREALERGLPDDVHLRVNGKLHISLTRACDGENVIINQFDSKEELIVALLCTSFIFLFSGMTPGKFRGVSYIDGGFSNNLPVLDDKTITVSPFAGEADICPLDDVSSLYTINLSNTSFSVTPHNLYRLSHALLPPPPEILSELYERGFADGIRFLQRMKLISCDRCLEIRSSQLASEADVVVCGESESVVEIVQETFSYMSAAERQRKESSISYDERAFQSHRHPDTSSLNSYDEADLFHFGQVREEELDEQEEEEEEPEDCDGCRQRSRNAPGDPLPKQFADRFREACDNVNKSLYNWLYSHRPIKYLSYLAAPYYLPLNISIALLMKYWQYLVKTTTLQQQHQKAPQQTMFLAA